MRAGTRPPRLLRTCGRDSRGTGDVPGDRNSSVRRRPLSLFSHILETSWFPKAIFYFLIVFSLFLTLDQAGLVLLFSHEFLLGSSLLVIGITRPTHHIDDGGDDFIEISTRLSSVQMNLWFFFSSLNKQLCYRGMCPIHQWESLTT